MKITRALLLSSKKQAESWERPQVGQTIFGQPLYETKYHYLVSDKDEGGVYRFQIFRVYQERKEDRSYNVVAPEAHVNKVFLDVGELLAYLHQSEIDSEESWQPVED